MKLCIGTTLWKRPRIEQLTLRYYKRLAAQMPFEVDLVCAVSTPKAGAMAYAEGWATVAAENKPLGRKHNKMLQLARTFDPDAFVLIGSDNWLTPSVLRFYEGMIDRAPLFGWTDLWIINAKDGATRYWPTRQVLGPGRMVRRDILRKLDYELWPEHLDTHLDDAMAKHIAGGGARCGWTRASTDGLTDVGAIVDFKTEQNMWSFNRLANRGQVFSKELVLARYPADAVRDLARRYPALEPRFN